MAMNLRLPSELAEALRALAEETGRSQQELARDAIAEFIDEFPHRAFPKSIRHLVQAPQDSTDWEQVRLLAPPLPAGTDVTALVREMRGRSSDADLL